MEEGEEVAEEEIEGEEVEERGEEAEKRREEREQRLYNTAANHLHKLLSHQCYGHWGEEDGYEEPTSSSSTLLSLAGMTGRTCNLQTTGPNGINRMPVDMPLDKDDIGARSVERQSVLWRALYTGA